MVRADANSGWPGEEIGIQSGLFAQLTTRCSTGRLPRSTRPPGEPNPATDAAQQRAEPGGLFCLRVNATGTDGWPAHAVTERPPRWRSHALSAGRWPTARPLHQATPAGRNGVISELLPIGVLLFIRYQKRQGRRPGALAWTALVGAHAYSLTVQLAQAVPTVGGWIVAAALSVAFMILSKMVVLMRPTQQPRESPGSDSEPAANDALVFAEPPAAEESYLIPMTIGASHLVAQLAAGWVSGQHLPLGDRSGRYAPIAVGLWERGTAGPRSWQARSWRGR